MNSWRIRDSFIMTLAVAGILFGTLPISSIPAMGYATEGFHWCQQDVNGIYFANLWDNLPAAVDYQYMFRMGPASWNSVPLNFYWSLGSSSSYNVEVKAQPLGATQPHAVSHLPISFLGCPINAGAIVVNSDRWAEFDWLQHIWMMAHELGHELGIDHSTDPFSVMYGTFASFFPLPQPDDMNGAASLYGWRYNYFPNKVVNGGTVSWPLGVNSYPISMSTQLGTGYYAMAYDTRYTTGQRLFTATMWIKCRALGYESIGIYASANPTNSNNKWADAVIYPQGFFIEVSTTSGLQQVRTAVSLSSNTEYYISLTIFRKPDDRSYAISYLYTGSGSYLRTVSLDDTGQFLYGWPGTTLQLRYMGPALFNPDSLSSGSCNVNRGSKAVVLFAN